MHEVLVSWSFLTEILLEIKSNVFSACQFNDVEIKYGHFAKLSAVFQYTQRNYIVYCNVYYQCPQKIQKKNVFLVKSFMRLHVMAILM